MTGYLLLAALVPLAFWIGWRAHLAYWLNNYGVRSFGVRIPFDEELWIDKLTAPMLAVFAWLTIAVYCAARGWLS